jgi:regulation of enolase protein 1 (concanavalin A-like superfamily)
MHFKEKFHWINEGEVVLEENRIIMMAPALTDFFCGGETTSEEGILPESLCNAPYYYTEIDGDFVLKVKVSHEFRETYDSASVMVMHDMTNWAKCCYELTDFGTHAAVSVVTINGESDDANGCNIEGQDYLWLKVCRVGRAFSFHYSLDGEKFNMTRYFLMPETKTIKVGLLAQAPTGNGGKRIYENLSIEHITVKNIRAGE